jgi:hypothetical protein
MERCPTQAEPLEMSEVCTQDDVQPQVSRGFTLKLHECSAAPFTVGAPLAFAFHVGPVDDGSPRYICVGRCLPSGSTCSIDGSKVQLEPDLVSLLDRQRGGFQPASRHHALFKLDPDGQLFLREWDLRKLSCWRRTRIFPPDADVTCGSTDFAHLSGSSWLAVPDEATVHFVPNAPPPTEKGGDATPYLRFMFKVSVLSRHLADDCSQRADWGCGWEACQVNDVGAFAGTSRGAGGAPASAIPASSDHESSTGMDASSSEDEDTPTGMFCFQFVIPQSKFGAVTGIRGTVIESLRTSTQCKLQWSARESFFPGTQDRVLQVSSPVRQLVLRGCASIADTLGSDRGKDSKQAPRPELCLRGAYPHRGPLALLADSDREAALAALGAETLCEISMARPPDRRGGDSIITLFGPPAAVAAALGRIVEALPPDSYRALLPDYAGKAVARDGGKTAGVAQPRRLHRLAQGRKRRAADQELHGPERKQRREAGQAHPRKPSARAGQRSHHRYHRRG